MRNPALWLCALALLAGCAGPAPSGGGKRQLMIVGNDEKQGWDEAGRVVLGPHGKDSVQILDIGSDPLAPRLIATLALDNTIAGPPVNLAITPDEKLALVANSLNVVEEGGTRKQVPDTRLFVIDLASTPPKLIDTLNLGKQPSGLSINRAGNLALVANRADNSVSVLRIAGRKVTLIDTVAIGESVAHVRFTPDGKRALAAKFPNHKIALLQVDGEKVSYGKVDLAAGLWPYNVDVTPDGRQRQLRRLRRADRHRQRDRPRAESAACGRQGGDRRRSRGPGHQPDRPARGSGAAARQQRIQERLLLQPQWLGGACQDRRQEHHARQRGRGAGPARRRRLERRRPLPLRGQLHRPQCQHPSIGG